MEQSQIKHLRSFVLILIMMFIDTNMLGLFVYFNHTSDISKIDNTVYVSIQQESSPFDYDMEDYIELHNLLSAEFKYDDFYSQPLYNENSSANFYEANSGELKKGCEVISSVQIGQTVSDTLNLIRGYSFNKSDFIINDKSKIPIILGNDYESLYSIGDTFELEYLYDIYEFEVIGILEKNSQISLNMTYCLDKMIVMPFVTFPASSKLTDGQIIHYANYTSGVVEIPADRFTTDLKLLKDVLNQKSCGDYSYAIQQQFFFWKDYLGLYPQTLRSIFAVAMVIISILLIISLVKHTISLKWDVALFILILLISVGVNEYWTTVGLNINFIYYLIIPILYLFGIAIKSQMQKKCNKIKI